MNALRAAWQVPQSDGTDLLQLLGVAPYLKKRSTPHVATGERKLDAGIDIAIRRNVTRGVASAARLTV
jgi:hypothetical protein